MKIRKKITLWISGTALLSTIAFSSLIFFELMEEPFKFIDRELAHMSQALVKQMESPKTKTGQYDLSFMPYDPDFYWIRVTEETGKTLYKSKIADYTDILPSGNKSTYLVEKTIPRSQIWLEQDGHDDVLFRVMVIQAQINHVPVEVRIAKPIENLEEELINLAVSIAVGLALCTLIIIFISYLLAGKILAPITAITRMSKKISDTSLNQRIPLGTSTDELYDLSVSLNRMFDRLQYSFKRQKEFVGNASHELKSPITLLMLAQEEVLMNHDLSDHTSQHLIKQLDTTRRMSHLVKNLLDLSRLEQQESFDKEILDLSALAEQVLDDYSDVFAGKNIKVQNRIRDGLSIYGDRDKLFRLLINLIDNAIRYNRKKDGTIILTAHKTNGSLILKISNTGKPVPKKDIDRVFDQFYQVEKSRSIAHGGSGLGLAIAKKIVDLHNGSISIANDPDNLVSLSVTLPIKG